MPIIEARKNPVAEWIILQALVEGGLRRMFGTVWLHAERATLATLRGTPPAQRPPLIWVSPHPSWWDGYLAWLVNRRLGNRDGYLMMDAEFLPRYRFFTWGGAFGVDRKNPRAALESVDYIAGLLRPRPTGPCGCSRRARSPRPTAAHCSSTAAWPTSCAACRWPSRAGGLAAGLPRGAAPRSVDPRGRAPALHRRHACRRAAC